MNRSELSFQVKDKYKRLGMDLIAKNKVALVLYASEYAFFEDEPKTISIQPLNLPSRKSILQMFLERVHHLALLCILVSYIARHKVLGGPHPSKCKQTEPIDLPIYIMTSEKDNDMIFTYLEKLRFMGFSKLFVFPQKDLPAFNEKGLISLRMKNAVHLFPNGSGGLFNCIQTFDLVSHMQKFGVELLHMINCQNVHGIPLDPVMLGMSLESQNDVVAKAYDSRKITFTPANIKYLAENDNAKLEVVFVDSITNFNFEISKSGNTYQPRYIYLVDFVMRFDFISKPEFRKNFNFMEKYKFKQIELKVYDPLKNSFKVEKSFLAEIQIEELFALTPKFSILIEAEDKFMPVIDKPSFDMSSEYLGELFDFRAQELGLTNNKGKHYEVDSSSFYDQEEIDPAAFLRQTLTTDGRIIYSMY